MKKAKVQYKNTKKSSRSPEFYMNKEDFIKWYKETDCSHIEKDYKEKLTKRNR